MRTNYHRTTIYGLVDPRTNELRYVGKSNNVENRYISHLYEGAGGTHKHNWVLNVQRSGHEPELIILEIVDRRFWKTAEMWWIEYFRFLGARLTNTTKGGDGLTGMRHSKESRKKMSDALKDRFFTEEWRSKISKAKKGTVYSEEYKQKMSIACTGRVVSDETRANLSKALKGISKSEEHKRKISETLKGTKLSEETRRKMSEAHKRNYAQGKSALCKVNMSKVKSTRTKF